MSVTPDDIHRMESWLASTEFAETVEAAGFENTDIKAEFERLIKEAIGNAFSLAI
ncbi:hypothetical protein N9F34_03870 [Alphaproteobacteria bacterium]|nr:hypothetical protein [Alphaproteobacteria bacterium]